jgi:hypothetical protein
MDENVMNALFKPFGILAVLSLLISACGGQSAHAESADSVTTISYRVVLGKSLNDKEVADFITSNNCSPAAEYQLCKDAGIAFWVDANQTVNMVYLYAGNAGDFRRYRGQLPFGLSFYDPKWRVEEKLRELNSDDSSSLQETWQAGLPDKQYSPDHMRYWAFYKPYGMTVIYNSPGDDEDAYIYAVVVSE